MKFMKLIIGCLTAVMLASAFGVLFAAGLSTNFSDVYIDDLKIGGTYNLTKTANFPMNITQSGGGRTDISVETTIPSSVDLKAGYEAIPDKSWITYSKTSMPLLSGETGKIDVTVTIPDDKKYMGKKYMAHVFITGVPAKEKGGVSIALGIKGKIYISIASGELSDKEKANLKANRIVSQQGILVLPEKFYAEGQKDSAAVKVTEYEPLKLINPSKESLNVTLEAYDPSAAGYPAPEGYKAGKLSELGFSKTNVTLPPDGVGNIDVFIKTGAKTDSSKLFYVIRINVRSQRLDIAKFVPVYLN